MLCDVPGLISLLGPGDNGRAAIYARLKDSPGFRIRGCLLHGVGDCGCFKFHDDALPGLKAGIQALTMFRHTKETQITIFCLGSAACRIRFSRKSVCSTEWTCGAVSV